MKKIERLGRLTFSVASLTAVFGFASGANRLSAQDTHEQYACIVWQSAPIDESGNSITDVRCPFDSPEGRNLPAVKLGFQAERSEPRSNSAWVEPTNSWLAPQFSSVLETFQPEIRLTLWCRAPDADPKNLVPIRLEWSSIVDPAVTGDLHCDSTDTRVLQVVSAETRVTW
jgi:hypothetical protein